MKALSILLVAGSVVLSLLASNASAADAQERDIEPEAAKPKQKPILAAREPIVVPNHALLEEAIKNIAWQWRNNPLSCVQGIQSLLTLENRNDPAQLLCKGQSRNERAQNVYRNLVKQIGHVAMAQLVATTSYAPTGDKNASDTKANLQWQYTNNLDSMALARRLKDQGEYVAALNALCKGQQHNGSASDCYRALFRDDPDLLFEILGEFVGP